MNRFDEDFPWPRRGDKLFTSEGSDWWNKACLTHFSDGWWIYAAGYKLGADLLVQYVTETHKNQDRLIYPIVFLYRQYLELRLKELIKNGSTIIEESSDIPMHHDIFRLWVTCRKIFENIWPDGDTDDLDSVEECIREFNKIDPSSTAFRYPVDKHGLPALPETVTHINIRNIGQVMQRLNSLLDGCDAAISNMLSWGPGQEDYV